MECVVQLIKILITLLPSFMHLALKEKSEWFPLQPRVMSYSMSIMKRQ